MRRWVTAVVVVLGLAATGAGLVLAVTLTPVTASEAGAGAFVVALAGLVIAAAKLYRSGADDETVAPPPWTEEGALVAGTPEETADPADVTGADLATLVEDACERAREADTVADGFSVVRPPLRETLERVFVAGGADREAVDRLLASGEWTDDRVAAAVVDERVQRPTMRLRDRVRVWLFPERVVRRGTARAVGAIADAADRELPPVVGQRAPRSMPTLAPALGTLQRQADGRLQRARRPPADRSPGDGDRDDSLVRDDGGRGEESGSDEAGTDAGADPTDGEADSESSRGEDRPESLVEEVFDDA
ncbi:MAG: hypothetical protein ABEI39_04595 [Halobacteriales archaeon]